MANISILGKRGPYNYRRKEGKGRWEYSLCKKVILRIDAEMADTADDANVFRPKQILQLTTVGSIIALNVE
jgi:hypothetical protein